MATHDKRRNSTMDPHDELARLLALVLRSSLGSQSDTILLLHKVGFGRARIAELIGTTPGTVNQEIIRAARKGKKSVEAKNNEASNTS